MDHSLRKEFFIELEKEIKLLINKNTGELDSKYSRVINCPVCSASEDGNEFLFKKNGFTFVRCNDCGMMFTNPQVKTEILEELYENSKSNELWVELQRSKKEHAWKKDYYLDSIDLINKHIDDKSIRLLDVGCNNGYFLEVARENTKWKLKGIDLNEKALKLAQDKGLNVEKTLLSLLNDSEQYNLFTLHGVLEHIPEPKKILNDIKIKTAKNSTSYSLMIVPNAYSLYHMFLQEKSPSFDGRDHLIYFSEDTLRKLFELNGFEVVSLDTVLTGISALKRQAQWFDPNGDVNTEKYLSKKIKNICNGKEIEDFIYKNNLGLRLRILAKYTKE
jgi:SAM-dependent methyltransferase